MFALFAYTSAQANCEDAKAPNERDKARVEAVNKAIVKSKYYDSLPTRSPIEHEVLNVTESEIRILLRYASGVRIATIRQDKEGRLWRQKPGAKDWTPVE
jgi:hypothetical protein